MSASNSLRAAMLLRKACKNAFRAPLAALLLLTSVSAVHGRSLRSFLSDPPGPVHPTVPLSTPPIQTPTARVVFDDTAPFSPKTAGEHRHERNEEAVNARGDEGLPVSMEHSAQSAKQSRREILEGNPLNTVTSSAQTVVEL